MACITRSRPHDERTAAKVATGHVSAAQESDQSVDHNPEYLKSIYRQVPNTTEKFLKYENCKSLIHAKRFAFGNLSFFQGKKTSTSLGSRKTACTRLCETHSSTTCLVGTTRPKAKSGNMPCQSFFVDILSKYIRIIEDS